MDTNQSAAAVLARFGVIYSPIANLSQVAGIEPFLAFLKKGDFRKRWTEQFGFYQARTMLQFILGLVVGARLRVSAHSAHPFRLDSAHPFLLRMRGVTIASK